MNSLSFSALFSGAAIAAACFLLTGCGGESSASAHGEPAHAPAAKSDHGGGGHGGGKSSGHGKEKEAKSSHGGGGHGKEAKGGGHGGGKSSHGGSSKGGHGGGGSHGAAPKPAAHGDEKEKGHAQQLLDGLRRTPEESLEIDLGVFTVSRQIAAGQILRVRFQLIALVDAKQEVEFQDALAIRQQAMRDRVIEISHDLDLEHFDDPTLRALKSDLLVAIQRALHSLAIHEVIVSEYVSERR